MSGVAVSNKPFRGVYEISRTSTADVADDTDFLLSHFRKSALSADICGENTLHGFPPKKVKIFQNNAFWEDFVNIGRGGVGILIPLNMLSKSIILFFTLIVSLGLQAKPLPEPISSWEADGTLFSLVCSDAGKSRCFFLLEGDSGREQIVFSHDAPPYEVISSVVIGKGEIWIYKRYSGMESFFRLERIDRARLEQLPRCSWENYDSLDSESRKQLSLSALVDKEYSENQMFVNVINYGFGLPTRGTFTDSYSGKRRWDNRYIGYCFEITGETLKALPVTHSGEVPFKEIEGIAYFYLDRSSKEKWKWVPVSLREAQKSIYAVTPLVSDEQSFPNEENSSRTCLLWSAIGILACSTGLFLWLKIRSRRKKS